ncbi:MAG: PIG-L family deacetylase [Verrucomicrobia bacterium]|nr:PIG-L family deacetylase [Verrucomicrobiota bacterium]
MKKQAEKVVPKRKLRVLGVAAHPDDLEIGCGGTLFKMHEAGYEIYLAIMTFGEAGGVAAVRRKEQEAAGKGYGARKIYWMGHEDTRVRVDRTAIEGMDRVLREVSPDLVFANYAEDTHQDHRSTATIVLSSARYTQNVLFYEVTTTMNFTPEVFVDITGTVEKKCSLLRMHRSQWRTLRVGDLTAVDCARSMALFRGVQGRVKAAEGFAPLRLLFKV